MERIDFQGSFFQVPEKPKDRKETSKTAKTKKSFLSLVQAETAEKTEKFESLAGPGGEADLEAILDQVHELGEKLKNDPTLNSLQPYKQAVKKFLKIVVDRCYKVEERTSARDILRQKKFTQIQILDTKLERLAAGVMAAQKDQLEILRRVDEINGALVDLLQ